MTSSTARRDVHSPVNLVTEDYEYIFAADLQSPWALGLASTESGREFLRELSNLDPATADRGYSQCHHCGARLRYCAWLKHLPSGYTIVVGETCLANRFERATADFQRMRKQAELDRERHRIKLAVAEFCEHNEDLAWMAIDNVDEIPEHSRNNFFVRDVARKLRQYGSLSERQIDAVRNTVVRDAERAAERAAREPEGPAGDVPTGEQRIEGVVVSRKQKDTDFGERWKLTVKGDAGWRVWITEPSRVTCEVGDRVRFHCTVTVSERDASFGFGHRPSQFVILDAEQLALELADTELDTVTAHILSRVDNRASVRFAIPSQGDNDLDFLAVYNGRVERHLGAPGDVRKINLAAPQALTLAKRIDALNDAAFVNAQAMYGAALHYCGRCGASLTDDDSRARGFGPDCWGKA